LLLMSISLTLLVTYRMALMTVPFSSIAIILGFQTLLNAYGGRAAHGAENRKDRIRKVILFGILAVILLHGVMDSSCLMFSVRKGKARFSPPFKKALAFLRTDTSPASVIWANAYRGYLIQTYSNRATLTDALLEIPEIRRRIIEGSHVLLSDREADLLNYCTRYNVNYILVSSPDLRDSANYLGIDYYGYFTKKGKYLSRSGRSKNIIKLLYRPQMLRGLELVFKDGDYSIYHVVGTRR
ncbi:MAG: hypothetical protein PHP46_05540, partial [Candidatus Omnitrophica bacterium]|nr:hypothetical protein [Candidatus Omnitrophota bacterium]